MDVLVCVMENRLTWRPARADWLTCFLGSALALAAPPFPPFARGSDMSAVLLERDWIDDE